MNKYAEILQDIKDACKECLTVNDCVEEECRWYWIAKALKKQVPEKPKHINKNDEFDGNWVKVCPACGIMFIERFTNETESYPIIYHKAKYCKCGQAIDWSDAECQK